LIFNALWSVRGEPFDSPFALRLSKGRTVRSGQALSNHERTYDTVSKGRGLGWG